MQKKQKEGTSYLLSTAPQFLKIYQASFQDFYRNEKNNNKDFAMISYLENLLSQEGENEATY